MKKILLLLILIVGIGSLMGDTSSQTVNITNSTEPQTITFAKYSGSGTLVSVRVELYMTVTGGTIQADNDSDTQSAAVTLDLGASFDLQDGTVAPRLLNNSPADIWGSTVTDHFTDTISANSGDEGGAGHPDFDPSAPDGVSYAGTDPTDTDVDDIGSTWVSQYAGTGTFDWTLVKTGINNVASVGGSVDGFFTSLDLGGHVKITYDFIVPVTLSSFTAMYFNEGAQLQWTTQSESGNMGWNIYRSTTGDAEEATQLNVGLIEGAGTVSEPTDYMFTDGDDLTTGQTYYYWIEDVTYGNVTTLHGPVSVQVTEEGVTPETPEISQKAQINNYPNPFNPDTNLFYSLKDNEVAETIEIYNVRGQKVRSFDAPNNPQQWDGKDMTGAGVSSGIYMYVLKTNQNNYVKKMVLSK